MNEDFYIKLGLNIKKLRNQRNLTQQQLADKIGKGLNFTGKIEVAFSKPSLDTIIKIADALDVTVSDLTNFKYSK
jgi:transcriptional regulator with XRE-family HTH domain